MGLYIGTKLIKALVMTRLQYNQLRGWEVPNDENPADEGYLVEYIDGGKANHPDFAGYISWSPKDVFERAYQATSGMDFGMALAALKVGKKIARAGWNGTGMYAFGIGLPGSGDYWTYTNGKNDNYPLNALIGIKNVSNTVSSWVPSVGDCLANDWYIVE